MSDTEPEGLSYAIGPRMTYSPASRCPDFREHLQKRVAEGTLPPAHFDAYKRTLDSFHGILEQRLCPEGLGFQNVWGIDGQAASSQDERRVTERTTAWWIRSAHPFSHGADDHNFHRAAVAYLLDAGMGFIPLTHTGRFLDVAEAASSLDVNVRFRGPAFSVTQWILIELHSEAAGHGRTLQVGRVWTEEGDLIAIASQTCILRFKDRKTTIKL